MNTHKSPVSLLMFVCVLMSACAPKPATHAEEPTQPISANVLAEVSELSSPAGVTFGFGSIWVQSHRTGITYRIEPDSNKVIATIPEPITQFTQNTVVAGNMLWVGGSRATFIIDPKTNSIVTTLADNPCDLTYGFDSMWEVGSAGQPLKRLDPTAGKEITSIDLEDGVSNPDLCYNLRVTSNAVWVITNLEIIRIDPAANSITSRVQLDKAITDAKVSTTIPAGKGTDFIWLLVDHGLLRIDPSTGAGLTFLPLTSAQEGLQNFAVGDTSIWLMGLGHLTQVNVATNQIQATYKTHDGNSFANVSVGLGSVWVSYLDSKLVQRLDLAP